MAKVSLAVPTPEQAAWQDLEVGMFIHFAPNTWCDKEQDDLSVPLDKINPTKLDTDQWVRVAESMGARYIMFVAKHTGGFCWWPTATTDYCVKSIPWRNGNGDVMKDLSESCRRHGIKLGVYLSPADKNLGASIGGKCKTEAEQKEYDRAYRNQLTELLTGYGEIVEVWFDGSLVTEVGDILAKHVPHAMVFQGKHSTIRWIGTEWGYAPYPAWNAVSAKRNPAKWGGMTALDGDPDGDTWLPNEVDTWNVMPPKWFWNSRTERRLKAVEELMDNYYRSVGHGAVLLLNQTPDPTGLIPEADAKRAAEFGAEIKRRFGRSLAEASGAGEIVELDLGGTVKIDHVIAMEDITKGERVREYVIEVLRDGKWRKICQGTAIGHKKIDCFKQIETDKIRLRTLQAVNAPVIRKLAAYCSGTRLEHKPELETENFKYHKIGGWEQASFKNGTAHCKCDITPVCNDATQYEICFRKTGGRGEVEIAYITYVFGGTELKWFIQPTADRNIYDLNITGVGNTMFLDVAIKSVGSAGVSGDILIKRKSME